MMKSKQVEIRFVVGIDVAKDKLDFYASQGTLPSIVDNDEAIFDARLGKELKRFKDALFVVEATGGYERKIVKWLQSKSLEVAIVNPKQVRHFAKGIGYDAKTDSIDAKVIAKFGEVVQPTPTLIPREASEKRDALVTRRKQLLALVNQESNRLKQTDDPEIQDFIRDSLANLKKQLKRWKREWKAASRPTRKTRVKLRSANPLKASAK